MNEGLLGAVGLGAVQGVTEFLPVSSSGHLALFALLAGDTGLALRSAVLLHAATLAATAIVLRRDLLAVARAAIGDGAGRAMAIAIVLGSLPTAILGLTLKPVAYWALQNPTGHHHHACGGHMHLCPGRLRHDGGRSL